MPTLLNEVDPADDVAFPNITRAGPVVPVEPGGVGDEAEGAIHEELPVEEGQQEADQPEPEDMEDFDALLDQ